MVTGAVVQCPVQLQRFVVSDVESNGYLSMLKLVTLEARVTVFAKVKEKPNQKAFVSWTPDPVVLSAKTADLR